MTKIRQHAYIHARALTDTHVPLLWAIKSVNWKSCTELADGKCGCICAHQEVQEEKVWFCQTINLQAHCVCACVHTCGPFLLFPIFRKSDGASHCSGPQWMSSYCGSGALEQLDEFMVSAKKRRSLSFCQSWFPPRSKCRPLWAAKGGRGPQPCI